MKITALFIALSCSSCIQMSQQLAEPIPPPSEETLDRPIPKELQRYYTLPLPIRDQPTT